MDGSGLLHMKRQLSGCQRGISTAVHEQCPRVAPSASEGDTQGRRRRNGGNYSQLKPLFRHGQL